MGQVNELKDLTRGQIDAALMKIGQDVGMSTAEGIHAWLRGDLVIQSRPLPFRKNEYGHYVLTIVGRNLNGMNENGFEASGKYAKQVLKSEDYNDNHRLEEGKEYSIVLIPGRDITENRTTANIREYARGFGYEIPRAGIMPRIREAVSDRQMGQMEIWYIAGLHDPIKDADGDPDVLFTNRSGGGRWLDTSWDRPDDRWGDSGAFAFLVPAS